MQFGRFALPKTSRRTLDWAPGRLLARSATPSACWCFAYAPAGSWWLPTPNREG